MRFAENNRISHRQLYRQLLLTFPAPFLLCLFQNGEMTGISGMAAVVTAAVILSFYGIWLIRLGPVFGETGKNGKNITVRFMGLFFLAYVILTAAFLCDILASVIPESLISGISGKWLSLAAVAVCSVGTHRGMQRRGRVAEISGGIFLAGLLVLMLLCAGQGRAEYLMEMTEGADGKFSGRVWAEDTYFLLCGFGGAGLLPFSLEQVEKQGSARKPVVLAFLTVCGIVLGMQLLLPAVFGKGRLLEETYPVLPLLDGTELPGNVLARFDVIWMGLLVFGLLFALGSLFHYGACIGEKTGYGTGRYWIPAAGWLLSIYRWKGYGTGDVYRAFLEYIFVPGLIMLQIFLGMKVKKRRKKKMAAAGLLLVCLLTVNGCAAVEPEKRLYPLALGTGATEEGLVLKYAMPDMDTATGQEKPEEATASVLTFYGKDFHEIEEAYNRSQEKFLDTGHLQVVILDETIRKEGKAAEVIRYLKREDHVGEDVYVFLTGELEEVFRRKGQNSSTGEYLQGIQENRTSGQQKRGVTLREVYHQFYKDGTLPWLPQVRVNGEFLEVDYGNSE